MKQMINRLLLPGITVAMLGVTSSALAEWGGRDCGGPGMHRDSAKVEKMREHYQTELHDKLKLSASQEKAWKTFIAQGKELRPQGHPDRLAFAGLNAPQRMEKMLGKMHEREGRMDKMLAALKTFYATLTPQQQKIFDDALPKPGEHRMSRG